LIPGRPEESKKGVKERRTGVRVQSARKRVWRGWMPRWREVSRLLLLEGEERRKLPLDG
jgi:hypothetical protein